MFQEFALFPHKNVFENVAFGLKMQGMDGEEIEDRTRKMLKLVGMSRFMHRDVADLSGGERQRVARPQISGKQRAIQDSKRA